jgi:hypothetical protein
MDFLCLGWITWVYIRCVIYILPGLQVNPKGILTPSIASRVHLVEPSFYWLSKRY